MRNTSVKQNLYIFFNVFILLCPLKKKTSLDYLHQIIQITKELNKLEIAGDIPDKSLLKYKSQLELNIKK